MANKFLDKKWLVSHLKQIKEKAGRRYAPKLNVDLPISEIFDGICRTKNFYTLVRTHSGKLEREFFRISSRYDNKEIQKIYNSFSVEIRFLLKIIKTIKEYDIKIIRWKSVGLLTKAASELSWKLAEELRSEKEKSEKEKSPPSSNDRPALFERLSFDIHGLYEVQKELRYFEDFSSSTTAELSNQPFLLLKGPAGSGKTHLLCDVVERRTAGTFPSALLFGELFLNGEIWRQIARQLGFNSGYNKEKILKELNESGRRKKVRSLLIIDALNESNPIGLWKKKLNALCREVRKYPHIALVVSIRSGFEKEVFNETDEKLFIIEEHHGFQFREWEAVTKFFHEFSLPLPEIPLLMPEFQNPLFLLLFCEAFQNRSKKNKNKKSRQIFRGHEGATFIFETYIDKTAKKIEDNFNIDHGPNKNIWDTIIEKVAEKMVEQNNDRISEEILINIIQSAHPNINHNNLISAIEKSFLLVKVPRYSVKTDQAVGFDYRFPFQKFSDHLIGRYIFKKFKLSKRTPKQFFGKNTRIGKFIKVGWNRGIIEALSIQCPEWLNGIEFFEVAPYIDDWIMVKAFTESLVWRRPDAFSKDLKNTLGFINRNITKNEEWKINLLNAFLSIAAVPKHPFNAQFLHKHLLKFLMPARDSWWSTFLHYQYGEREAVDRLIEWGWSNQDKKHISDESIKLYSITLVWFFTCPNRFLRDKATKALVALLTDRLNIIVELLEQFKIVDDPSVLERLYAVAYGCSLRNTQDSKGIKKLANWFLSNVFKKKKVPTHILMRDYARGVVEAAIISGEISAKVRSEITPPYGSRWPNKIPAEKTLRKKYYPNDFFSNKTGERGFLDIWSSVMHNFGSLGDFGNYEVNSELGAWSGRRLNGKEVHRKKFFEEFKKGLTKEQSDLLNRLNPFYGINFGARKTILWTLKSNKKEKRIDEAEITRQRQEEKKNQKTMIGQFKRILSARKRQIFKKEIEPYLDDRGGINDPLDRFDTGVGQRWIFNRVVELGWDFKLHGGFDNNINNYRSDRSEHKAERIGKKYQWIALHELLALVADNFEFLSERWSDKTSLYEGAWQTGVRDIDPSCILKESPNQKIENIPTINAYRPNYNVWEKSKSLGSWLKETKKLPNPISIIEITDDKGYVWVVLEGYCEWQEEIPPEYEKYKLPTKTLYFLMKSYIVEKKNKDKIFTWSKRQKFYGRWMPESNEFYHVYLGEYPSYPAFLYHYIPYYNHDGWTRGSDRNKIPAKILVTDDQYLSSGSSIDCSTGEAIKVKLPAKWIVDGMRLTQKYKDGRFFDKDGDLVAFDPKIFIKNAPSFLLMRKDKLLNFLQKKKCSIFWTLLGEKQTIGGGGIGQPHGWQEINGTYTFNKKGKLIGSMSSAFKKPTSQ